MRYEEAHDKFVNTWGSMGSNWGINKTMAQIHALLLISEKPLSTEDIMEQLQISRGNANMNVRALQEWGLIHKELISGDRKDYFVAGKDIWKIAIQIIRERRKREIEPVMEILTNLGSVEGDDQDKIDEFNKVIHELSDFTERVDKMLGTLVKSDKNWFQKNIIKLLT